MKRLLLKCSLTLRRLICRIFGHVVIQVRDGQLVATGCKRCGTLESLDQILYTARAKVTRGDIEARMTVHPPEGYSFVDCNWKKRKAKFVAPGGRLRFVDF